MDIFKIQKHSKLINWNCKLTSPLPTTTSSYCVSQNGDVLKIEMGDKQQKQAEVVFTILGSPSAIAQRTMNGSFLISDLAHQSIFLRDDHEVEQIHNLITQFEERAFSGPSSLAVNDYYNHLYFTDSGPFGETSLQNPSGSLFLYNFEDKSLRALAFRKLAYPCGIALDPQQKFLQDSPQIRLVCEMAQNRIIKFVLDENYSGNFTVFHQFSGRMGPSSICFFNGFYYISLFQFNDIDNEGIIAVLNEEGDLIEKIKIPTGGEITGIQFVPPLLDQNFMIALITEGNALHEVVFKGDKMDAQQDSEGGL